MIFDYLCGSSDGCQEVFWSIIKHGGVATDEEVLSSEVLGRLYIRDEGRQIPKNAYDRMKVQECEKDITTQQKSTVWIWRRKELVKRRISTHANCAERPTQCDQRVSDESRPSCAQMQQQMYGFLMAHSCDEYWVNDISWELAVVVAENFRF